MRKPAEIMEDWSKGGKSFVSKEKIAHIPISFNTF
jgi:hypothetical protein